MDTPFHYRRGKLVALFDESRIDSVLVTHPANWFYLTGFTGESGALVVSRRGTTLVTDGRFLVQAKAETKGVRIFLQNGTLLESAVGVLRNSRARRVGFDAIHMTVSQLQSARKASGSRWQWVAVPGMVERLRMRKDAGELAQMRKAAILAGEIMEFAIGLLKPGVSEREVVAEIEYQMRQRGASGPAFETIVAFGDRAALPHARPTGKRLRKNELVELAQMRKAAILAGEVVEFAIGLLKPGVCEREIGAEIEYEMRKRGASGPAFETIVAFGDRAALPHARPTGKRLRKNELVVLDLGVILGHYCSDITRTVFVGRAPKRIQTWYKAVLEAQGAAISAVREGVSCGEVDAAARRVLE